MKALHISTNQGCCERWPLVQLNCLYERIWLVFLVLWNIVILINWTLHTAGILRFKWLQTVCLQVCHIIVVAMIRKRWRKQCWLWAFDADVCCWCFCLVSSRVDGTAVHDNPPCDSCKVPLDPQVGKLSLNLVMIRMATKDFLWSNLSK